MMSQDSFCRLCGVVFLAGLAAVLPAAAQSDAVLNLDVVVEAEGVPMAPQAPAAALAVSLLSRAEVEAELTAAHAEIERLKDIVRRILIANRREKQTMHYNIGCIMREVGQPNKAEQAFLEALAINPRDPAVHYNLGILYDEDLGRPEKARKHYRTFLDLAPHDKDSGQVYKWLTALQ